MPDPRHKKIKLFVFFGMVASGKSTLAKAWSERYGMMYHNTDVVRKQLAGIIPSAIRKEEFSGGIYAKEFTRKTYDELLRLADQDLRQENLVVLDGSYHKREERESVVLLADRLQAGYLFVMCTCSEEEVRRRLAMRAQDPDAVSDGRWEIYLKQKEVFEPPEELDKTRLICLNTEKPVENLLNRLQDRLEHCI